MRSIFLALTVVAAYALLRGLPEELHPVLRNCLAVLVLVLGIGLWQRRARPAGSVARSLRRPSWSDYLAVGLGILSIECLFLCFLTVIPSHAESLSLRLSESLSVQGREATQSSSDEDLSSHGSSISGNWLWDTKGRRPLPLTSNARPSNKPEIFFRPRDPSTTGFLLRSRAYLRAFALERFDAATWTPVGMPPALLTPDEGGRVNLSQPETRPGPLLRGEIIQASHPRGEDLFTAPQGATQGWVPQLRHVDPGIFRLNPAKNPEKGYTYEVAAKTVTLTGLLESGELPNLRFPDLPEDSPRLQLPSSEELRDEIINLSSKTLGDAASRLVGLRNLLWQNFQYSLEIENPKGIDPVLNFLRDEKRGHCEFFATAGALLCRALNIPSRIAYGWSGGKWYEGPGYLMFRASEAHAWTEIYLEDVGWVVFDTTPPGARTPLDLADANDPLPLMENDLLDLDSSAAAQDRARSLWTYLALSAGLGLLPVCLVLLRLRRRSPKGAQLVSEGLLPNAPGYLTRFRQACREHGYPMPPSRTLRQQLHSLAERDQEPDFAKELLRYHYSITYGNGAPCREQESNLMKAIKLWS